MTTTFCVGNVNPGEVRAEFMHGMMDLAQNPTVGECEFQGFFTKSPSGPYLDVARNFVVERFLQTDADVLLFIDSDIEFSRESVERIVGRAHPDIVNGGYYVSAFPGKGIRPVAFDWDENNVLQPIVMPDPGLKFEDVDVVGTGFMAIHRDTLQAMLPIYGYPSPWFAEEVMHGSAMGEDVTFCQRVIHGLGRDVVIDFRAPVNHIKPIKLTPSTRIY